MSSTTYSEVSLSAVDAKESTSLASPRLEASLIAVSDGMIIVWGTQSASASFKIMCFNVFQDKVKMI